MNYYDKIAAYLAGELNDVESLVFEQELAENPKLQKEVEAVKLAQNLFDFSADYLSEATIMETTASEATDQLIQFTTTHLSEAEILKIGAVSKPKTVVRKLNANQNRAAWLVAASMLFILIAFGIGYYNNQNSDASQPAFVETPSIPHLPSKNSQPLPKTTSPEEFPAKVVVKTNDNSTQPKYEPAKVKVIRKNMPKNLSEAKKELAFENVLSNTTPINPIALNTTAQEISSATEIASGQVVIYSAEKPIILKTGFHAKAGSTFTATPLKPTALPTDLTLDGTIAEKAIEYKASNTIILKPGFHAKAGTDFTASTETGRKEVSSNAVISDKETVTLKAKSTITLMPGFHAKAGAKFVAKVGN